MQAYTHFMVGAIIQRAAQRRLKRRSHRALVVISLGITLHILIDELARFTYHPADAKPDDIFWKGYHLCVALATLIIVVRWRRYILGMLCSVIPDLDWVIRPLAHRFHWAWQDGSLHAFFKSLPLFHQIDQVLSLLPNWTEVPATAILEILLAGVLLSLLLRPWPRRPEETPGTS